MAACRVDEIATSFGKYDPTPFVYFFHEALKKGYKTAESAFYYAQNKTIEATKDAQYARDRQHPVMFDSYPADNPEGGELRIAK